MLVGRALWAVSSEYWWLWYSCGVGRGLVRKWGWHKRFEGPARKTDYLILLLVFFPLPYPTSCEILWPLFMVSEFWPVILTPVAVPPNVCGKFGSDLVILSFACQKVWLWSCFCLLKNWFLFSYWALDPGVPFPPVDVDSVVGYSVESLAL